MEARLSSFTTLVRSGESLRILCFYQSCKARPEEESLCLSYLGQFSKVFKVVCLFPGHWSWAGCWHPTAILGEHTCHLQRIMCGLWAMSAPSVEEHRAWNSGDLQGFVGQRSPSGAGDPQGVTLQSLWVWSWESVSWLTGCGASCWDPGNGCWQPPPHFPIPTYTKTIQLSKSSKFCGFRETEIELLGSTLQGWGSQTHFTLIVPNGRIVGRGSLCWYWPMPLWKK